MMFESVIATLLHPLLLPTHTVDPFRTLMMLLYPVMRMCVSLLQLHLWYRVSCITYLTLNSQIMHHCPWYHKLCGLSQHHPMTLRIHCVLMTPHLHWCHLNSTTLHSHIGLCHDWLQVNRIWILNQWNTSINHLIAWAKHRPQCLCVKASLRYIMITVSAWMSVLNSWFYCKYHVG